MSVIIPANNEAAYIGACLEALIPEPVQAGAGAGGSGGTEIVVVANACTDDTVAIARSFEARAAAQGWRLIVLDLAQGGKLNALNAGDRAARGEIRVYVDGDLIVSPQLLGQIRAALDRPEPAYAGGRPTVAPGKSRITRAYARIWVRVPFITECVPGCGVYAVNAAGRARWGEFPDIISDDTFVRLQFAPEERIGVPAPYHFWLAEGFGNLVRVRRRQDVGVAEIARRYPALMRNEDKPRLGLARLLGLAARDPVGFGLYVAVALAVRRPRRRGDQPWSREP